MIRASRCVDPVLIGSALKHPKIYDHLTDDGCPDAEDFEPPIVEPLIYVAVEDERFMGVFVYHPQNSICFEVHTCLLPDAWGKAKECALASLRWFFENTPCERVITNVPAYNRLALHLALKSGMTQFGINTKSFKKNGTLHDQIMLGMNKEALCRQ